MMIIIAVAVVAIVIIGIAAVLLLGNGNDGTGDDNGGTSQTWDPAVGDFVEYSVSAVGNVETMRIEIVAISGDNMTIETTSSSTGTTTETVPKNSTFFPGDIDFNLDYLDNPPSGTTIVDKGSQRVSLDFGSVTADHYLVTISEEGFEFSFDIWIAKNMPVKMTGEIMGYSFTMEMTDTNIF